MGRHRIFCSACDREVEVELREGGAHDGATDELAGAVCGDLGAFCTGAACPICATGPVRLAGLPTRGGPDAAA